MILAPPLPDAARSRSRNRGEIRKRPDYQPLDELQPLFEGRVARARGVAAVSEERDGQRKREQSKSNDFSPQVPSERPPWRAVVSEGRPSHFQE